MKYLYLIVLVALLNGSSYAQEYKEIRRQYVDLTTLDHHECLQTFRWINGNWMDCSESLPQSSEIFGALTSGSYPTQSFTYPIPGTNLEFFIRISTTTSQNSEKMLISAYYKKKKNQGNIESLSSDYYQPELFAAYLKRAFSDISRNRGWFSERSFIAIPAAPGDAMMKDTTIDSIYVVRRTIELNVNDCRLTFASHDRSDNGWPFPDWVSECSVKTGLDRSSIPLSRSQWDTDLQGAAAPVFTSGGATLTYDASGYTVSFRGQASWEKVKGDVASVIKKANDLVHAYYLIKGSELKSLSAEDELLGTLILKKGLLGVGPLKF